MAIVKIKKKENPYVQIDKQGIEDNRLSWGATGLLTYLVGRPDNWEISITHLSKIKTNKESATRNALNELREFQYCHFFRIKYKGKNIDSTYLIFETPTDPTYALSLIEIDNDYTAIYEPPKTLLNSTIQPHCDFPHVGKPHVEKPHGENQALIIIDNNNIDITNKNVNNIDLKNNTCNMPNPEKKKNRKGFPIQDKWEEFLIENLPGIDYQSNIQKQIKKLEKRDSEETIKKYLLEVYTNGVEQNKTFEVIANTIATGNRINTPKPKKTQNKKNNLKSIDTNTIVEDLKKELVVENTSKEITLTAEDEEKALELLKKQGFDINLYNTMKRKSIGTYYKTLSSILKQAI
ncbi:hypothetical protein [Cetobacterium sp.]|uniref:hypothetical protein n=1 Tax=Cetobacterium sp. TaxID=2071632 RepID=UPI003F30CB37